MKDYSVDRDIDDLDKAILQELQVDSAQALGDDGGGGRLANT